MATSLPSLKVCGLADFERRFVGGDHGRFLAAKTQVNRPPHLGERDRRFLRLDGVARDDDRHVRDDAHDGDVFDRLMRRAVRTDRDAGMRARDLDVGFVERHDRTHLLPRTPGIEHRITRDPRNLSHRRESARHRDEHLLGDADLDVLLRIRLLKAFKSRRFGEIGTDAEHVVAARSGLDQSLAETVARGNQLEVGGAIVGQMHALRRSVKDRRTATHERESVRAPRPARATLRRPAPHWAACRAKDSRLPYTIRPCPESCLR